jgi:hypothetical protein
MAAASGSPRPAADWRLALSVGPAVGFSLPVSQKVTQALEPSLGFGGAFLVSALAAAAVGGLTAGGIAWLLGRRRPSDAETGQ